MVPKCCPPHLLLETIKVDELGRSLENLDFVAFRSATPLRSRNITTIESECVAARRGFPAKSILGESALPRLLGKVEENVIEVFTVDRLISKRDCRDSAMLYLQSRHRGDDMGGLR